MITKDFLWWLLKDNTVVNHLYLSLGKYFFPSQPVSELRNENQIIDKDFLLDNGVDNATNNRFSIRGYTSGTTNKPLTVFRSLKSIILEEYILKSYLHRHKVPVKPKVAIIRGELLPKDILDKGGYSYQLPFSKRLLMSSYHLSEETIPYYLKALEEYKPDIIMAYPSSISLIAKVAKKNGWEINWPLVTVFTSSELFKSEQQELVRSVFGKVLDHYGQAERVAVLQQCEFGNYHVRDDYSDVYFVDDANGTKIVGSNRHNIAMPLEYYDTGDYVQGVCKNQICRCGQGTPHVKSIIGRDDDYIILPDGRHVGRLDVAFKGVEGIVECQLEQINKECLIIRLVPSMDSDKTVLKFEIESNLRKYLGNEINIEFEIVSRIKRTSAGKFRSVVRRKDIE